MDMLDMLYAYYLNPLRYSIRILFLNDAVQDQSQNIQESLAFAPFPITPDPFPASIAHVPYTYIR
jgi:hypothetical protein